MEKPMKILLNETEIEAEQGLTLADLVARHKPGADVLILNGFPARGEALVAPGDRVALIRRGEVPDKAELEAVMVSRHTPGVHEAVKKASVGIAGIGGLGSHVAVALARLGVGKLVLVDFDVVEPSNLNRQCYFVDQLGMTKAEALTDTLRRINPFVTVDSRVERITPENVKTLFEGCSVLVEAFDRADQKAMLVETALVELPETLVVAASGLAGYGPAEKIVPNRIGRRLIVVGDLLSEAKPGSGLMAPRVGVAAHMQANLVLRAILGEEG